MASYLLTVCIALAVSEASFLKQGAWDGMRVGALTEQYFTFNHEQADGTIDEFWECMQPELVHTQLIYEAAHNCRQNDDDVQRCAGQDSCPSAGIWSMCTSQFLDNPELADTCMQAGYACNAFACIANGAKVHGKACYELCHGIVRMSMNY